MTAWFSLLATVVSACLTYDSFRFRKALDHTPFTVLGTLWKNGLRHMPLSERARVQESYQSGAWGIGRICWMFLIATIALAVSTVRAFLAH